MSQKRLFLRPHHGMCLAFFQGRGYSTQFSAHMGQVLTLLQQENPLVVLTIGSDIICQPCPNLLPTGCSTSQQVARYDRAVLTLCQLEEGAVLPWHTFSHLVNQHILQKGRREGICGDCEWNWLCRPSASTPSPSEPSF